MSFLCTPANGNVANVNCRPRVGGLAKEIYVANLSQVDTITSSTSDKVYDAVTMKTNPATTQPYNWYRIVFKKGTASINNEGVFGNNTYYNQSVTFSSQGITANSLSVFEGMSVGEMVFIAVDMNGTAHLLGKVNGLEMSANATGTGAGPDDMYGSTITFTGAEPEMSNLIATGTTIQVLNVAGTAVETITF